MDYTNDCGQGDALPLADLLDRSIAKLGPDGLKLATGVLHAYAGDKSVETAFWDKDTYCVSEVDFSGAVDQVTVDGILAGAIKYANARIRSRAVAERLDKEGQDVFIEGGPNGRNPPWPGLFCWVRLGQGRWISVTAGRHGIYIDTPFCRKVVLEGTTDELHRALLGILKDANAAIRDAGPLAPAWGPSMRFNVTRAGQGCPAI